MRAALLFQPAVAGLLAIGRTQQPAERSSITIDLLDDRIMLSRVIAPELVVRLVNIGGSEHQGWEVEVLRRPVSVDSRNLIHYAPHGPDLSEVFAWHVAERHFPDERTIDVRGYPITVTIQLIDPRVTGTGPDARFVSGRLRVGWKPRK